jgi:hypothetical protein
LASVNRKLKTENFLHSFNNQLLLSLAAPTVFDADIRQQCKDIWLCSKATQPNLIP